MPEKKQCDSMEQFTYGSYIKTWQAMCAKKELLLNRAISGDKASGGEFLYDIPGYLEEVCQMLRKLLGGIAGIGYEDISVVILYQIPSCFEGRWKCIEASDRVKDISVSGFMKQQDMLLSKLMEDGCPHYYISDENKGGHNGGTSFGIRTDFKDGGEKYANGMLLISTGKRSFGKAEHTCEAEGKTFENVLVYTMMPYFVELIRSELGQMYLWEQRKDKFL